jgi:hypothetical protein
MLSMALAFPIWFAWDDPSPPILPLPESRSLELPSNI